MKQTLVVKHVVVVEFSQNSLLNWLEMINSGAELPARCQWSQFTLHYTLYQSILFGEKAGPMPQFRQESKIPPNSKFWRRNFTRQFKLQSTFSPDQIDE